MSDSALREALFWEPCRDFDRPASCWTNDGTGLWCEPCEARRRARAALPATERSGCDVAGCTEALTLCVTHAREGFIPWYERSGLDVERLARALVAGTDEDGLDPLLEPEQASAYAARIAAAYDAEDPAARETKP